MKKNSWFFRFRDRFLTPWWSRYVLVPTIASAPGAFAAYWFASGNLDLHGYHAPVVMLAAGIWAGAVSAAKSVLNDIAKFSMRELLKSRDELLHLLGHVRAIVATKSNRFHENKLPFGAGEVDPAVAFMTITRPDVQIREIIRRIQMFFFGQSQDALDDQIRVLLMRWNPKARHMNFVEHFPEELPPLAPEAAFYDGSTAAGLAKDNGAMVIVEDVAQDARFRKLAQGRTKKGSMIAYPVFDDLHHDTVLVINVVSNAPRRFKETDRESLELWMQVFADRLLLENRLFELKARARQTV